MESRPLLLEPPCFLVAMDRVATLLAKDVKAVDGDIVNRLDSRSNDMLEINAVMLIGMVQSIELGCEFFQIGWNEVLQSVCLLARVQTRKMHYPAASPLRGRHHSFRERHGRCVSSWGIAVRFPQSSAVWGFDPFE